MNKIFTVLMLIAVAACAEMQTQQPVAKVAPVQSSPADVLKEVNLGCFNVKAVNDPEHGKVYYTQKHNLFKYVQLDKSRGDRYFCNTAQAEKAGFKPAEAHFSGSVYYLVECLHSEGPEGECHRYISGIYQSLKIYDKVCGSASHGEMAEVVEDYANEHKDAMDSGKYEGTTAAFIHEYPCR